MNEAQRQFALGVAGVRLWYARAPLPGAAPSTDFDFSGPDLSIAVPEAVEVGLPDVRADRSRQGLSALQGMLASSNEPARVSSVAAPKHELSPLQPSTVEPVQESPEQSNAEATSCDEPAGDALASEFVAFHWRFWIGARWMLVSKHPETVSRGLEDGLAANILKAVGDHLVRCDEVCWPVFRNPAVPGNNAAGAVDVLAGLVRELEPTNTIQLGLDLAEGGASEVHARLVQSLGSPGVAFPMSLAALASDPSAKRALWQALKAAMAS